MKTIILLVIMTFLLIKCIGSSANLKFSDLKYPMSLSPFVYGTKGEILSQDNGLDRVGSFTEKEVFWGIFYSIIPLTNEKIIVNKINNRIKRSKGDAAINVVIVGKNCNFDPTYILSFLPIYPGCTTIYIHGDIVRIKK